MHKVFVYGSLKRGFGNAGLLADSDYLGHNVTKTAKWLMFSMGGFPGVMALPDGDGYGITGEIYEVNDEVLANLDQLEGNGSFYTREEVLLDCGYTVWMYVLPYRETATLQGGYERMSFNKEMTAQTWELSGF